MSSSPNSPTDLWARHSAEWRSTAQICSQWSDAARVDSALLETRTSKAWWELLHELGITLLVTREYEHLVMAMSARGGKPRVSYFPIPHPSGLAVDRERSTVWLASTRNPNQVYKLRPAGDLVGRTDVSLAPAQALLRANPLVPAASAFYPGSLYLHDLAVMGGNLYGNAVGHNAVVKLSPEGSFERVWWPRCTEREGEADFTRNYIQLNSIAAGRTPRESFYTASSASMERLRPGHLRYPVDQRGVLFSGRTRQPVCEGLTRPHSARTDGKQVWIANSGYGELGVAQRGKLQVVAGLPGWTRGLCLHGDIAFVGTSRIIERYARYAPGLDAARSICGVHAVSKATGKLLASLEWPAGNQLFAIDWISDRVSAGFTFETKARSAASDRAFFYSCLTE